MVKSHSTRRTGKTKSNDRGRLALILTLWLGARTPRTLNAHCSLELREAPSPGLRPPSPPVGEREGVRGFMRTEKRLPVPEDSTVFGCPTCAAAKGTCAVTDTTMRECPNKAAVFTLSRGRGPG